MAKGVNWLNTDPAGVKMMLTWVLAQKQTSSSLVLDIPNAKTTWDGSVFQPASDKAKQLNLLCISIFAA